MAVGADVVPSPAPKKAGIDYSKFDNIVDSDDDKPEASAKEVSKPAAEEKPRCQNCDTDIKKALRCGVCKKVSYCSAKCQKEDWQFHKRNCKKPEEPKPKAEAERRPPPKPSSEEKEKRKKEETVVEDEETFNWYRHREWKPENKQDFKPSQIEAAAATSQAPADGSVAGSAWNKAGTWEEKDVTALAKTTLKDTLSGLPDVDVAGGSLVCDGIDNVEGDASKPVIRNKLRHIFDLSFKVDFTFRWMDSDGQRQAKGHMKIADFTNDTFSEGSSNAPEVEISFKDSRLLDEGRRKAVEASLSATCWPPPAGSFMGTLAARMEQWTTEYSKAS